MTEIHPVSFSEFEALRRELAQAESDSWRRIPWHISLARAMSVAARENKPLAMIVRSGHPLGCTCNNGLVERAAVFGDPVIASLLSTRYVAVAIDQHIHRRLKNAESRLFTDLVNRAGQNLETTAQGFYVFSGSGERLAFTPTQHPAIVQQMLTRVLAERYPGASCSEENPASADAGISLGVPDGVTVLDVVSKVLGGYAQPATEREQTLQSSFGRDHCWLREDESSELARGIVPDSLLIRMARFHLVDNTRGEPPRWRPDQIRSVNAELRDGRLAGSVQIATAEARRGYEAALFGLVEIVDGAIGQFDVVARGAAWGRGYHNGGAPRGRYPMAVRFMLAKPAWPFDAIPPGAARTRVRNYLGMQVMEPV